MKKVTTNMTFGQILFILFILLASSLMFFYFGAKFGGDIMTLADRGEVEVEEPFFPDDKLSAEIQDILANHDQKLVFHEAVIDKGLPVLKPQTLPKEGVKTVESPKSPAVAKAKAPDNVAKKVILPTASPVADTPPPAKALLTAQSQPVVAKAPEEKLKVFLPAQEAPTKTYRLQVGSYAQKKSAFEAKSQWESRGYDVSLAESTIPGKGTWYRLYVGRYDSQEAAASAQSQIMKSYRQTAMILEGQ